MASAHVLEGVNVWQTLEIQSIGTWATAIAGGTMLTSGLVFNQVKSIRSISSKAGVI
jgi:hypothetical protein